ncbi:MAG: hypothetical protein R2695_08965 [Acidimicrobiales bacterium]
MAAQRSTYELIDDPHPVFDLAFRWLDEHRPRHDQRVVHGRLPDGATCSSMPPGSRRCSTGSSATSATRWRTWAGWWPGPGASAPPVRWAGSAPAKSCLPPTRRPAETPWGSTSCAGGRCWPRFAGVITMFMGDEHRKGSSRSVEQATIGRRVVETEYDVMLLLLPELIAS